MPRLRFAIDMPAEVLAHSLVELEMSEPRPLLYDLFVLLDPRRLHWQAHGDEPGMAEQARDWHSV